MAAAIAGGLRPGDVVLLMGEVGTGKTTFVRGAARELGVAGNVTSPSFTIGRRYEGAEAVSHIDLFRLDSLADEDPALLADYIDADSIAFVEWPKDIAAVLPLEVSLSVRLSLLGGDRRRIELEGRDELVCRMPQ